MNTPNAQAVSADAASSERSIGEIIAAATTGFIAQVNEGASPVSGSSIDSGLPLSHSLQDTPAFGSFVRVGAVPSAVLPADFDPFETAPKPPAADDTPPTLYGVVYQVEAGANLAFPARGEFGRSPFSASVGADSVRQAGNETPTTHFSVALIAYAGADGTIRPHLPPRPPRPNALVYAADTNEIKRLTERLDYLRSLLSNGSGLIYPNDELVAALLRQAWRARGGDEAFLLRAGKELATLLPQDYDRLRALLSSIMG